MALIPYAGFAKDPVTAEPIGGATVRAYAVLDSEGTKADLHIAETSSNSTSGFWMLEVDPLQSPTGQFAVHITKDGKRFWVEPGIAMQVMMLVGTDPNVAPLMDLSVTNAKIGNNAVSTGKIQNLAVTGAKLAEQAVSTPKLADYSVAASKIADGAVTSDKIAEQAVTTEHITDDSVTESKIQDLAVTAVKLASNAVTAVKIAAGAITTEKISDLAVTAAKLATNAVTSSKLAVGAVTTDKIADNSVTASKLADDYVERSGDTMTGALNVNTSSTGLSRILGMLGPSTSWEIGLEDSNDRLRIRRGSSTRLTIGPNQGDLYAGLAPSNQVWHDGNTSGRVSSSHITNGAVTSAKIASGAVTDTEIHKSSDISTRQWYGTSNDIIRLGSGTPAIVAGPKTGEHLAMGRTRIQAKIGSSAATLRLNHEGGDVLYNGEHIPKIRGGRRIAVQPNPPSDFSVNDIWIDTS